MYRNTAWDTNKGKSYINICGTDIQAFLNALYCFTSKMVFECLHSITSLSTTKSTSPGLRHQDIEGNKKADELAQMGSQNIFTGACSRAISY